MAKQQEVLQRYEDEFEKVSITASESIQAGDHLVLERQYYDHHMLCIYSSDNHVIVIHYTGTAWGISRGLDVALFKDIGVKGEIMEEMYSFEDLVTRKVRRSLREHCLCEDLSHFRVYRNSVPLLVKCSLIGRIWNKVQTPNSFST